MNRKKRLYWFLSILTVLIIFIWVNNTSHFIKPSSRMKFNAHRGLAQNFDISTVKWDTNTAAIIYPPEYPYLENTIESMQVAYGYSADVVEFDIQLTKDGKLACFHDYTLEYRTNGQGQIADFSMAELKRLDIGYGYTADGGQTYPFRGKGIGLMPDIEEVFCAFPDGDLLIHIKSDSIETGEVLWSYLGKMSPERLDKITVYGSKQPVEYLRAQCPTLRAMNRDILIKAVLTYEAIAWTGYIPKAIQNTELHLPLKYARYLWGWPHKFVERMESVNTRVVIVNGSGEWSEGFDNLEDLKSLPRGYNGYVWTNRIDKVAGQKQ